MVPRNITEVQGKSMFRHRKHGVPILNTTSTADISFMLLIFFLVASSMDIDKGLSRQLPPVERRPQQEETEINRQKLLEIKITDRNLLLVDGHPMPLNRLSGHVTRFIMARGKDHLISIDASPESAYDVYFHVQNALVEAYRAWRDRASKQKFGHDYHHLSPRQREEIRDICPQRVAETYDMAGKGGRDE